MRKKAVLLISGGIDSATVLEIAKSQSYEIHALSFSYGQRHSVELDFVQKILKRSPVQSHRVVQIDLRAFGGSALTSDMEVPKSQNFKGLDNEVPVTYVPARNTIFLSFAVGFAETIQAYDIFMGANRLDASNYPDCRPEYIQAFEKVANLGTRVSGQTQNGFKIHTPLIQMTKTEVIQKGLALGVDYSLTISCYDPTESGEACGTCIACHLRLQGFRENQMNDPCKYR